MANDFEAMAERMIRISKEKPLLPETYVPWADEPGEETLFIPARLVSLEGHPLWETLTAAQQRELGRLEGVQVMYSYAWSETLACLFFNRHLLTLNPDSVEYRFLLRELMEEFRHQEMFGMAIRRLERVPVLPTRVHKFLGNFSVRWSSPAVVFMSVLSVELMADLYAKHIRKDENVYSVMRKTSELHHIEEGRHIFYTEAWLERYTKKAGFFRATTYSLVVMMNLYFMRTLYVKQAFFEQLGVPDPEKYFRAARARHKEKFADLALSATVTFVKKFKGFNFITRPLWRKLLDVKA